MPSKTKTEEPNLIELRRQAARLTRRSKAIRALNSMSDNQIAEQIRLSSTAKASGLIEKPVLTAARKCATLPTQPTRNLMEVHTDGGCRDNGTKNAIGAWAFHVVETGYEQSSHLFPATNNRAELTAVIEALKYMKRTYPGHVVRIITDSLLTIKCATKQWKRKTNQDLWAEYFRAAAGMKVDFQWVKGHSGVHGNERCDRLCGESMDAYAESLVISEEIESHMRSIRAESARWSENGPSVDSGWRQQK